MKQRLSMFFFQSVEKKHKFPNVQLPFCHGNYFLQIWNIFSDIWCLIFNTALEANNIPP